MLKFILISILLMIPVAVYLYFYIYRMLCFWSRQQKKRWITVCSIVAAVGAAAASMNIFSTGALIVLHLVAIGICMELINFIAARAAGKQGELKVWKCIYRSGVIPVCITMLILAYGYFHMQDVRETDYNISTEKQLRSEGYRVALITDLHFGTTMDRQKLEKYCQEISEKEPDIVLLGGDIVDERSTREEMEAAFETLGKISSNFGIYYVYGNHDKASYYANPPFTREELEQAVSSQGITILEDQTVSVNEEIILAGRQDLSEAGAAGRRSTEDLLMGMDKGKFVLLLDHQPMELNENAKAGVDLQLSGHTHGGQIWPVGVISDLLGFGELNYGFKEIGSGDFIVSSGIAGWGYPIRTGAYSEYVIVDLRNSVNF